VNPEPSLTAPNASGASTSPPPREPRVIHRQNHRISRKDISEEALKVLYRLSSLGFKAYLVGGGVRDLYLGKKPKDYDVGTDAKPSRLKRIFRNCRIIGRRFRIAHVFFPGEKIVEVATFRRGVVHQIAGESGVILLDNEYGTPEEDARRRDLTINGLFYDIATHSIIDFVDGVDDLENRIIRTINDPDKSFVEDPVRMIRALRHAARTGFTIEENTLKAIYRNRQEMAKANTSRLMEEMFKDLKGGAAEPFVRSITETHLLDVMLPQLAVQLREVGLDHPLWRRFRALDHWCREGRETTNAVLLSLLLHTVLLPDPACWSGERSHPFDVWRTLMRNFMEVSRNLRISRRDGERVAQILISFRKLYHAFHRGQLPPTYEKKPYLGEALDFLELDVVSCEKPIEKIVDWRAKHVGERPARAQRYPFGAGGFIGGGEGGRRRGGDRDRPPRAELAESDGDAAGVVGQEPPFTDNGSGSGEGPGPAAEAGGEKKRRRRRRGGRRRHRGSRHG
jgi:poly(A) polymerase